MSLDRKKIHPTHIMLIAKYKNRIIKPIVYECTKCYFAIFPGEIDRELSKACIGYAGYTSKDNYIPIEDE